MNRPKLSDYREVLQAREKYVNVQLRLNAMEKQASDINQQAIDNKENTDCAVDKYLAGENFEHRDMQQERISSLEKINSERRIAHKALGKAKRAVTEAEVKASKLICERGLQEYAEIPKQQSKALIAVQKISNGEENFRSIYEGEVIGFSSYIHSCAFLPALGNNTEDGHYSIIGHWHRRAVENGYLKPSDVPRHWCKAWALDSVQVDGQSKAIGEARPETTVKQNEDGWLQAN